MLATLEKKNRRFSESNENTHFGQVSNDSLIPMAALISTFKELSFDVWVALTNYAPFTHNRPLFGQGQK